MQGNELFKMAVTLMVNAAQIVLEKAGLDPVDDDMEFVKKVEEVALTCGYRPIGLCWMTWLVQPEGEKMRMEKYSNILPKI